MKQKFTLNIADIQLSVVTEAAPETVEKIAGLLDRKMREIFLQSRSVTRNEAAILCAMEFCSDRMNTQAHVAELEELTGKYDEVLRLIKAKNEELSADLAKLESENALLRSLITTKKQEEEEAAAPVKPVSPAEFLNQVARAQTEPEEAPAPLFAAPETEESAPATVVRATRKRRRAAETAAAPADAAEEDTGDKPLSKVGSMFDLLSFDEV